MLSLAGLDQDRPLPGPRLARSIDDACRSVGFFVLVDHGIDPALHRDALAVARRFFELPQEAKDRHRVESTPGARRGYHGLGSEAQAATTGTRTAPDRSETYCLGPLRDPALADRWSAPDVWPDADLPELQVVLRRYRVEVDRLARRLLRAAALTLCGQALAFDPLVTTPLGGLRLNHYPELAEVPPPGTWRAGGHTDYSLFTVLAVDGRPGLEILVDGCWTSVACPDDGLVVNVGELLTRLSGGRWRSTWHRVVVPAGPGPFPSRTSIAHFQYPNADAPVPGLRRRDGSACSPGDFLEDKTAQLFGDPGPCNLPPRGLGTRHAVRRAASLRR